MIKVKVNLRERRKARGYHNAKIIGADNKERTIIYKGVGMYILTNPDNINPITGKHFVYNKQAIEDNIRKASWTLIE